MIRPGDANEVVEAYRVALTQKHGATVLCMTRQALPTLDRTKYAPASGLAKGGYALNDVPKPDVLLIGTGSELALCVDAGEKLAAEGIKARVVSLPSWDLFEKQDQAYRDSVIPPTVTARVCVEMGSVFGLGAVRGQHRGDHRDAVVRRVGPAQGPAPALRLHPGRGGEGREGPGGEVTECQGARVPE